MRRVAKDQHLCHDAPNSLTTKVPCDIGANINVAGQKKRTCSRTQASRLCPSPSRRSASVTCQPVHSDVSLTNSVTDALVPDSYRCSSCSRSETQNITRSSCHQPVSTPTLDPRNHSRASFPLQPVTLEIRLHPAHHSNTKSLVATSCQRSTPTRHPLGQSPASDPGRHR